MSIHKKNFTNENLLNRIKHLIEIGVALSQEQELAILLEKILESAKELTHADGGNLYEVTNKKTLRFELVRTDSLHLRIGGQDSRLMNFPEIPLFLAGGILNDRQMASYAVNHRTTLNVKDVRQEWKFAGTNALDQITGYRTQAALTVPIFNHEKKAVAVIQLVNPLDSTTGQVGVFSAEDQQLVEALASQAGIVLANQQLVESLKELFEGLSRVIATAIDEKSPSTCNHGRRVQVIAQLLAEAIHETTEGPLKDTFFTSEQLYELRLAAFLHDCGKITIPTHLIEKSKKLETIFDRIALVDTRFEVMKRDAYIEMLEKRVAWYEKQAPELSEKAGKAFDLLYNEYERLTGSYYIEQQFLHRCNTNAEPITEAVETKIHEIGRRLWQLQQQWQPLLNAEEIENLLIKQGNLTVKEREIIENHVVMTMKMLSQLSYPKYLKEIPEIAGSHHEWVNGNGYPRQLTKEQMSVQARLLAVADVFEALSAPDRPYKQVFSLSQVLTKMQVMVDEGHLDGDIFEVFIKKKVAIQYASQHLADAQIDI